MARARTSRSSALAFDAITVEGALIAPAMLGRIARHEAEEQSGADYSVPKGLTLRDEIARYFRIGQALHVDFAAGKNPSLNATIVFVEKLLHHVLGFSDLRRVGTRMLADRKFAVTLEGLQGRVPIVVVPPADDLDRPSASLASDTSRRSAASALQDWLNTSGDATWGICCNGSAVRLVRANASLTRPAYIEADLQYILADEAFADFTALWLLIHASRFGHVGAPPSDCALERWRDAGQKEGVAARDRLRDGVEAALLSLGNGFLSNPNNGALRARHESSTVRAIRSAHCAIAPCGAPPGTGITIDGKGCSLRLSLSSAASGDSVWLCANDCVRENCRCSTSSARLLRLVYRLIFLLAAEDRNLLHPPSVPALDGLFAPGTLPDLEMARLCYRSRRRRISGTRSPARFMGRSSAARRSSQARRAPSTGRWSFRT
jgi:hypothetical protein